MNNTLKPLPQFDNAFNQTNILTDYLLKMKSNDMLPSTSSNIIVNTSIDRQTYHRLVTSPLHEQSDKKERIRSPKIVYNKQKNTSTSFMSLLEDDMEGTNNNPRSNRISYKDTYVKRRVKSKSPDSNPSVQAISISSDTDINIKLLKSKNDFNKSDKKDRSTLLKTKAAALLSNNNHNNTVIIKKKPEIEKLKDKRNNFSSAGSNNVQSNLTTTSTLNYQCKSCAELKQKINILQKTSNDKEIALIEYDQKLKLLQSQLSNSDELSLKVSKLERINYELESQLLNLQSEIKISTLDNNDKELNELKEFKESIIAVSKVYDEVNIKLSENFFRFQNQLSQILINSSNHSSKVNTNETLSLQIKNLSKQLELMQRNFNTVLKMKHSEYLILLNEKQKYQTTEIKDNEVDNTEDSKYRNFFNFIENELSDDIINEPLDRKLVVAKKSSPNPNPEINLNTKESSKGKNSKNLKENKDNEYNIDYLTFYKLRNQLTEIKDQDDKPMKEVKEGKYSKLLRNFK